MRGAYAIKRNSPEWIDGDFYLHVGSAPVTIEAGSRQRAMACVMCHAPAGGEWCYLLCLIAGEVCPKDGSHLGGLGFFCHVPCLPRRQKVLIRAVSSLLEAAHH